MSENQNVEYKETWRTEYLKWICGFANAQGGTVDTLMQPHESIPYNENIANAFYYAGYIETWGRGIQKICKACADIGADNPRYELIGNGLRVHFAALKSALPDDSQAKKDDKLGENTSGSQKSGPEKWPEKAAEIVKAIIDDKNVTIAELEVFLGVGHTTLKKILREMQRENIIRRVGPAKGGHWEVIGKEKGERTKT